MGQELAKIKIRVGEIEVDYEGDPAFLADGLNDLLKNVAEIQQSFPSLAASVPQSATVLTDGTSTPNAVVTASAIGLSTKSIAARMNAKSGPELTICAMAHLELVKGQDSYERKSILDEMKTATGYYNTNMGKNNAANVASLVKIKRVTEVGSGRFCLSANEKKNVVAAIADDV